MSISHWLKQRNDGELHSEAPGGSVEGDALERQVIAALRTIYDPEIPVNIYDLGLVYELTVSTAGTVRLRMTLTAPGCPVAQTFPGMVERAIRSVPGTSRVPKSSRRGPGGRPTSMTHKSSCSTSMGVTTRWRMSARTMAGSFPAARSTVRK